MVPMDAIVSVTGYVATLSKQKIFSAVNGQNKRLMMHLNHVSKSSSLQPTAMQVVM
jgi:hypothetical protein